MIGILLALGAALGFALPRVFVRLARRDLSSRTGTAITLVPNLLVSTIPALVLDLPAYVEITLVVFLWIGLMALLANPLGRLLEFISLSNIGVARSAPLGGSAPLFAVVLAVIFLGERPNLPIIMGTLAVVGGVAFILVTEHGGGLGQRFTKSDVIGYGAALGSAAGYSGMTVIAKTVVTDFAHPLVVASITSILGFLFLLPLTAQELPRTVRASRQSAMMYVLAGIAAGLGTICLLFSLERIDVVVALPLLSLGPLINLVIVRAFMQRLERLTIPLVLGTFVAVGGTVLVVVGDSI